MRRAGVSRLPASAPDDLSAVDAAVASGRIDPARIVAVLGKTEGNGCVNDFSRPLALSTWRRWLASRLGEASTETIPLVMSGGTEGGLAPHWIVLEGSEAAPGPGPALAIGCARTPPMRPAEIGRASQAIAVAEAVRAALVTAEIASPADVHWVQVKCPLLTSERIAQAEAAGERVATRDTLRSMGLSRGAAALGVALALGEIDATRIDDATIGSRLDLFSRVASCSAGIELMENEIVLMGQSAAWSGPLRIAHAVMADAFDIEAPRAALARLGLTSPGQLSTAQHRRVAAVLAKAEAARSGTIRGWRHIMLDDSDVSATRHARALVGGVLGGLIGDGALFVSGGAEHQGPDGGGPMAVIASVD